MKYVDEFREPRAAEAITAQIAALAEKLGQRKVTIMEVCGSHTMAISRFGIRSLLPENIELISGPGCPVCVTDLGYVDAAIELADRGVIIATFGDMLRVPGSRSTLAKTRAHGAKVEVCYSPLDAVDIAKRSPEKEVVFLAIGFETTIPGVLTILEKAALEKIENISLLTAFKVVPPAMEVLASDPEINVQAFLSPAHVSAIIGSDAYISVVEKYRIPSVVAGFEPLDILLAIQRIVEQVSQGEAVAENQYNRVVKPEGNKRAQQLIAKYLKPVDADWRGIGRFPGSGLGLREEYAHYDAEKRHGIEIVPGRANTKCRCGQVLKGTVKPPECELFGRGCTPEHPIGACMVSEEGTCAAYFKYSRVS